MDIVCDGRSSLNMAGRIENEFEGFTEVLGGFVNYSDLDVPMLQMFNNFSLSLWRSTCCVSLNR